MERTFKTQTGFLSFLTGTCLILFIAVVNTGCPKINGGNPNAGYNYPKISNYDTNQLVVWLKPNATSGALRFWLDSIRGGKAINTPVLCQNCDNRLMLLTGPGIANFIQQATATGGSGTGQKTPPQGEDSLLYYSVNFDVSFGDTTYAPFLLHGYTPPRPYFAKNFADVTVAVFDTGIDSTFFNPRYFYMGTPPACLGPNATNGWNFSATPPNMNWKDDFLPGRHGTTVSKFIVDQVNAASGNGIKLLPIKIHDSRGKGNLFSVLCGFSYAAERGAQIINASLGYYTYPKAGAAPDQNAVLLREYVKEYLTKKNILLIAAAGNDFTNTDPNKHDLDKVLFYPASLASDTVYLPNVIAVTTVSDVSGTVSPNQNFSARVVDVGVNADNASDYTFNYPFTAPSTTGAGSGIVNGSSFATPIVTGKICANYHLFVNPSTGTPVFVDPLTGVPELNKQNILSILTGQLQTHTNGSLSRKIRGSLVMNK
jgi:hypothetical protein